MVYIDSMLYAVSIHSHVVVASGMYHIQFVLLKQNIVVDEIGIIICSHLLAHAHTYL